MSCGHYCRRWIPTSLWSKNLLPSWVLFPNIIVVWIFFNSHKCTPVNWYHGITCYTTMSSWHVMETNSTFISFTYVVHKWAARCVQQSCIKCLVTWKQVKRDQLSNILWNVDIKFVSSYQIPCDECTCMHAVLFTTYVIRNCINAHISFALSCLNVTSWEMLKGWKWDLMVETFIQIWIPLSTDSCNKPKQAKEILYIKTYMEQYSRMLKLCIHILAGSYQWSKYSY
jgi:hypothetical protein